MKPSYVRMLLSLVALLGLSAHSAFAQETVVSIGKAGEIHRTFTDVGFSQATYLSTSQIDPVLSLIDPSRFGQSYTRDQANELFGRIRAYEIRLGELLASAILATGQVDSVNYANVSANPIRLRFFQTSTGIGVNLSRFAVAVSVEKRIGVPLFCESVEGRTTLDNIRLTGDYNFFSGDVGVTDVQFDIRGSSGGCTGALSFFTNFFIELFFDVRAEIARAIRAAADEQLRFANVATVFSAGDLITALRRFADNSPLPLYANQAIDLAQEVILNANLNTPGIILEILVSRSTSASVSNHISLRLSHAPVDVLPIDHAGRGPIDLVVPPNTARADIYYSVDRANWTYLGTTTTNQFVHTQNLWGARVIAIGHNAVIPGLESYPGTAQNFVSRSGTCGTQRC
jgi:hypothetical protein